MLRIGSVIYPSTISYKDGVVDRSRKTACIVFYSEMIDGEEIVAVAKISNRSEKQNRFPEQYYPLPEDRSIKLNAIYHIPRSEVEVTEEVFEQEALWAIRTLLENTRKKKNQQPMIPLSEQNYHKNDRKILRLMSAYLPYSND